MAKVGLFHPATFKLDGGAMFGIIPKPLWEKKIKADESNRILMSLRVMFYQTKNRLILIDTGIGDYHPEKFNYQFEIKGNEHPLEKCLNEIGKSANDVTDIVLTHLHFDHVGGLGNLTNDIMSPLFPNATLHLHQKHFEYAQNPTARDSGSFHIKTFLPLIKWYENNKKIHFVQDEMGTLIKDDNFELNYKISFGHTPFMLHPYDSKFIYMADLVPMAHHIKLPWVMGYDINPGITTKYKEEFYHFIIDKNLTTIFEHDNDSWGATIEKDDRGDFTAKEIFESSKKLVQIIQDN